MNETPERKPDTEIWRRKTTRHAAASAVRGPVLLVDDNPDDARLAQRAFQQLNPHLPITLLGSGRELIAHLQGVGEGASNSGTLPVPSVVMLDLRMPEMDGFAVMEWIAKQPQLTNIPVIAMTNFTDLHHLKRAYALGVRSYLLKPVREDTLRSALASLNIPH